MESAPKRDINELLTHGFFTTSRAKSPSTPQPSQPPPIAPSFLKTSQYEIPRERSRSREPPRRHRGPPPPKPIVEDEAVSIARESSNSSIPSYDPPLRGIIDQSPIILEAEVTAAEAARLQKEPCPPNEDENPERRFVFIPKKEDEVERPIKPERPIRPEPAEPTRPSMSRQGSRQDLPSLETKVPREIPPQFRRSNSAYSSTPKDKDETPKARDARISGEYFLSPAAIRNGKEYFSQSTPRNEAFGGRSEQEKRNSGGSFSGSRPGTPGSDHRNSGNESRGKNEKLTRPQQLSDGGNRRNERHSSIHPDLYASGRSSRSSNHSRKYYSSSEDDLSDSEHEKRYKNKTFDNIKYDTHQRSASRTSRSSLDPKPGSRLNSPLPSPKVSPSQIPRGDQFERAETFPRTRRDISRPVSPNTSDREAPRTDRLNPHEQPKKLRQASTAPQPKTTAPYPESLPIDIPFSADLFPSVESRRTPSIPLANSSRPPPQSHWAPPPFQPPSNNLEKPVGSFRRYSEDVHRGSIAPLPSCPRTYFVCGKNDWLTLPNCPSFNICPSCFTSTMEPTEFRNFFVPAARRSLDTEVVCDFGSSPWYRIAWLLTIKERRRDLSLFYGLAKIADSVQPCLGGHAAVRQWHSIIDPKSGSPVRGFDVCYSCVKSVETLLPPIRGIFIRTDHSAPTPRICDLRFDSKRFIQYFDALETTADKADYENVEPNLRDLASLARRFAMYEECQHDKDLIDKKWHIITQLPEFTVCEECFDEVVWPELDDGKAIPMMFNKNLQRIPKASCQLYSPKMRGVFRLAVRGDDYKLLAAKARERKAVEMSYKGNVNDLKRRSGLIGNEGVEKEIVRLEEEWRRWE